MVIAIRTGIFFVLAMLMGFAVHAADEPKISVIRLGAKDANIMRLVLEVDRPLEGKVSVLPDPYRVVVDLPATDWPNNSGSGKGQGFISQYRFGLFSPTQSRLVLDLKRPAIVKSTFLLEPSGQFPYRYVVDLVESDRASFLAAAKARKPVAKQTAPVLAVAPPKTQRNRKPVIVVDAGHGGHDPGTSSKAGHVEKHIALSAAKEIARQLKATGNYTVILTRDRDIFLDLRPRIEIARKNHADLFLSVHADSIKNPNFAGGTVYTLSEKASDREAAALAARENKADVISGVDLNGENEIVFDILLSLVQRETMNYSTTFASLLVEEFGPKKLIPRRPHRSAGFVVLKAPDVPSVLVEMGYLSSLKDARRVSSKQEQKEIARAITMAVNRYFKQRLAQQF